MPKTPLCDQRAARKYVANNVKQYNFKVNRKLRPDMLEWIESKENVNGYLQSLIDADMLAHGQIIRARGTLEEMKLRSESCPVLLSRDDPGVADLFPDWDDYGQYCVLDHGEPTDFGGELSELEGLYKIIGTVIE